MKKIFAFLLCLALLLPAAVRGKAAEIICRPGEYVTADFIVTDNTGNALVISAKIEYDHAVFELLPNQHGINGDEIVYYGNWAFISFHVADHAPAGEYEIRLNVIKADRWQGELPIEGSSVRVTVEEADAPPRPTATPAPTPLPRLEASAAADSLESEDTVFGQGRMVPSFARENTIIAPHPDDYDRYHLGVFTFRGDNFRRNAAYGRADIKTGELAVYWQAPAGSAAGAESGAFWPAQPAIVKWAKELRLAMAPSLFEQARETIALIEVIYGARDGKIYFLNMRNGEATREPIDAGVPIRGSVSVDSVDRPLLAVGQGADGGLRLYNLINGKEAFCLSGRETDAPAFAGGALGGSPLFIFNIQSADAMIAAGENGLLCIADLDGRFIYPNYINPDAVASMEVNPSVACLETRAAGEKETMGDAESSAAMYDRFVFMAGNSGVVRCVDTDTMRTVWAFDAGAKVDCALALDMAGEDLSLYFGNAACGGTGEEQEAIIRRMNALTGEEEWRYAVKCVPDGEARLSGCKASPVIGRHGISDLVIFTVNMVEGGGSRIIALDKQSGQAVWTCSLPDQAVSSPIAVYNENGDAWIIQCDEGGNVTVLSGRTGQTCSSLNLGGPIQGSPAAYKDNVLVSVCGSDGERMYCLKIQ